MRGRTARHARPVSAIPAESTSRLTRRTTIDINAEIALLAAFPVPCACPSQSHQQTDGILPSCLGIITAEMRDIAYIIDSLSRWSNRTKGTAMVRHMLHIAHKLLSSLVPFANKIPLISGGHFRTNSILRKFIISCQYSDCVKLNIRAIIERIDPVRHGTEQVTDGMEEAAGTIDNPIMVD